MSAMSSFFNVGALGGNPFHTPIGQKIEQATDGTLASENWAANMEICDMINESSDTARDSMKAIRKRLQQNAGKNHTTIMYTLTVLETCVKNCGKAFHILVSNKEFAQELVKIIGPKYDPPPIVQEKVLSLIQIWADAFRKQPDLQGVVQVYQELKNKGVEFPMTDIDSLAPIYTPQRSVPEAPRPLPLQTVIPISPQHVNPMVAGPGLIAGAGSTIPVAAVLPGVPATLNTEQIAKLQSELDIVSMNMNIFGEMLTELKPGHENPNDYTLLCELGNTCKEMQGRIVELIGKINHDEFTAELLRLNDELNNLFLRHARYEKNRDPSGTMAPSAILGAAMGIRKIETNKPEGNSLIDLSDEATGGTDILTTQIAGINIAGTTTSQMSQINSVSAQSGSAVKSGKDVDEFDMLAQSRIPEVVKTSVSNDSPKKDIQPAVIQKKGSTDNEEDTEFDEMAAWLGNNKPTADDGPEESVTSTEFEKFLAERAAAADSLPSIPSQTGSTPRQKSSSKKKEEDGLLAL